MRPMLKKNQGAFGRRHLVWEGQELLLADNIARSDRILEQLSTHLSVRGMLAK